MLVSKLPPDSALADALHPDAGWRTEHELLASLIESIDAGHRALFVAALAPHMARGAKPKVWDPIVVPRPGREKLAKPKLTLADIRAKLLGR